MNLIEQYQYFYSKSKIFSVIQEILGEECDMDRADYEDLLNQFFIETATWGIYKWEEFAGIPTPAEYVDIGTRRSNVLAALRSRDTTTVEKIRVVSESYTSGECQVIEDNENYKFYIKFVGEKGIPRRVDELKKSIERIKPAHLDFEFMFSFLIWDEFDSYNNTWDEWDRLDLTWDDLESYGESKQKGVIANAK